MLEIEGIGTEFIWLGLSVITAVLAVLAWKSSGRTPLDYDIFVVETQSETLPPRRVIQVVHMGYEERAIAGSELMRRMGRARELALVEDLSIVIQSPSTILEATPRALASRVARNALHVDSMRTWQMEVMGDMATGWESSAMAAAAAIAITNGRNYVQSGGGTMYSLRNLEPHEESATDSTVEEVTATAIVEEDIPSLVEEEVEEREEQEIQEERQEEGDIISLRLKFLDDTEREVEVPESASVGDLKRRHLSDLSSNVRLIFGGQLLREDSARLRDLGVEGGCVLHVLLGQGQHAEQIPAATEAASTQAAMRPDTLNQTREYMNAILLLLAALIEHLGGTWLGISRWMRHGTDGEGGERGGSPLALPLFHLILPVLVTAQLTIFWTAALLFPRFFDRLAISLLAIITIVFLFVSLRRNPIRVRFQMD